MESKKVQGGLMSSEWAYKRAQKEYNTGELWCLNMHATK